MKKIFLADSTYDRLLQQVRSFEDQPEDVILRLLDQSAGGDWEADPSAPANEAGARPSRAAPGSVLPVQAYWVPILEVLEESGGAAPSNDVIDALEERMSADLTEGDRLRLISGEVRWRNRARFARLRMKERGLLSDSSRRGVWEISPVGRKYLADKIGKSNSA
ncbi:MAG TPA: winged helix-turn-helix domain-containing protein [Solirubrobacterales bacterium]|nr:winged helix-turn-helix domain-containing protein [Solirubrobacterales bacterium]